MRTHVLLFGLVGGVLIAALKISEYRFLTMEHSFEIYAGIVAALFAAVGMWLGLKFAVPKRIVEVREIAAPTPAFAVDRAALDQLGITPREYEMLGKIAAGMSTREIAAHLVVSENTVKTHSRRLFDKLNARRRTEAVRIGKELGLLP